MNEKSNIPDSFNVELNKYNIKELYNILSSNENNDYDISFEKPQAEISCFNYFFIKNEKIKENMNNIFPSEIK